ncbi:hypothetical protein [Pseudonocardia sp. ICBG601]|uniref:ATP dependent DNA ligase n=1 Tax=Pseudonocardia sp. ICBG601 TaxID=2846759 RepID=UPI001CF6E42A|nr:hypothetical protein [Pseudonocardia sp. ICBG601]
MAAKTSPAGFRGRHLLSGRTAQVTGACSGIDPASADALATAGVDVPERRWITTLLHHNAEVVVVGWSPSSGNRNVLGSLLLAVHDQQGDLVYAGDVGTGFTDAARRQLLEQLRVLSRDEPPITGPTQLTHAWPGRARRGVAVHWVEPRLVGEIEYRSFSAGGGFRHPSWRGLRPDREPGEVRRPA